jgi:glutathione peroxidase
LKNIFDFSVTDINGNEVSLEKFKGKNLLIVNVASKCGFTPQYKELENIYQHNKENNFEILAFPCNQFGAQEPGTEKEIQEFCDLNYSITFPLFSKIEVNGPSAHPLYEYLKSAAPGILGSKAIKWNFTKFLVDKEGNVKKRYAPTQKPAKIIEDIIL